ncbi:hypothetical protein L3X38_044923 [Prunus dulcis]|uniref:Uncharacterized protein n=1 Tax=Prunus dulcis TaxID=3755 RepID=A0AAD4V1A1_PRUDU|nr:hypothetical protein L3X38_044923 [Prunus dulcis]
MPTPSPSKLRLFLQPSNLPGTIHCYCSTALFTGALQRKWLLKEAKRKWLLKEAKGSGFSKKPKVSVFSKKPKEVASQRSQRYAESVLGNFLHEPTVDYVKEACDTEEDRHRAMKNICRLFATCKSSIDVGTTIRDKGAPRNREEYEASIPENPDDWTQGMWEYMYQKEQEDMRNFAEQVRK